MFSLPRSRFAIPGALLPFVATLLAIPAAQASAEIMSTSMALAPAR
jgi:hypothetical protein